MAALEAASRYRWVILLLAFLAQMSNALVSSSVAPLAPLFQPELGLTRAQVGMFSSASYAGTWGLLLLSGTLTDRFGIRRMMSAGQLVTGLVMLAISAVGGFIQALSVMFAAGVGRAATSPGITKCVMDWFPPRSRATAMGLKQTGVPFAGILTASMLPALGLAIGWRGAIGAVGLFILSFGVASAIFYRDPRGKGPTVSRHAGLGTGLASMVRNPRLWVVSTISLLYVSAQFGLTTYVALFLNETVLATGIPDASQRLLVSGWFLALCQAGGVVGRVFWGAVSDRVCHGKRMGVLAVIGVLAAILSWGTSNLLAETPYWIIAALVFAFGATAIGWNGVMQAVIVEVSGSRYAGTGIGASMTVSQLGTIAAAPLFGFVVDVTGAYQAAWLLLCSFCLGGVLLCLFAARWETGKDL